MRLPLCRRAWMAIASMIASHCLMDSQPVHAQKLDGMRLLPSGGTRGTEVSIELPGKFEAWPISIWSDSPEVIWTATETSGKVLARIAPEARLGVHRVRFANATSASPLLRWVVSDRSEVLEVEPNDDYRQPQRLPSAELIVNGSLAKSGDVDHYAIARDPGQPITVSIDAQRSLRSPMDACLQVLDARGNVLGQNLDTYGLDPRLPILCPKEGVIIVRVFAFPETPDSTIGYAGGDRFLYRLHVRDGIVDEADGLLLDHAVAVAEPSSREQPTLITGAGAWYGAIETPNDEDVFQIETTQAGHWKARLKSIDFGSSLDGVLEILSSDNKKIAQQGDSGEIRDPTIVNTMKEPGVYRIAVRDLHGNFGATARYRLELEQEQPTVRGTVANDVFIGSIDKPIEIEVSIDRTFDCADEAQLIVVGLPEGFRAEPVVSRAKEDSAKKVKLSVVASKACSIPVRIELKQIHGESQTTSDVVATNADARGLWLIVQ